MNTIIQCNLEDLRNIVNECLLDIQANRQRKEELYSQAETARMLHCDRTTLYRWSKTGYLIPVKVGGKVFYKESDIKKVRHE